MKVLITGSNGFIGKNLATQLEVQDNFDVIRFDRNSSIENLRKTIADIDFICHMAGVNRPDNDNEFVKVNTNLTQILCDVLEQSGRPVPIIFSSSVHVDRNNPYGDSKLAAEKVLLQYSKNTGIPVYIFRLSHVIGKWCQPNYNSVVATFCHNIARGLPIKIDDPTYLLHVVYIDDLVDKFSRLITDNIKCQTYYEVEQSYPITVGDLAKQIQNFKNSRDSLISEKVGTGLIRALYSTYMSYLPPEEFVYSIPKHEDSRGMFAEVLKTKDSGQFSFFTAHPGITRGGHYHHSKTEKFLVVKGEAKFRFRNIITNETYEVESNSDNPSIIETIPGWAHDITNIGSNEMIVMLWANEIFDKDLPDTYTYEI